MTVRASTARWPLLLCAGALACGKGNSLAGPVPPISDRCFIIVASLQPSGPVLAIGDTVRMHASYLDPNGSCLPSVAASALVIRSLNPAVATVDSATGLVTAVAAGHADVGAFLPGTDNQVPGAATVVTVHAP